MQQDSTPAPVRGALFFTTKLLLLATVGTTIQHALGGFGSAANELLLTLGLAVAFALYGEGGSVPDLFRLRPLGGRGVAKSVLLGAAAMLLVQVLGALTVLAVSRAGGKLPEYYHLSNTPFLVALLLLGVLPPICEEMAYRGFLQHSLRPLGPRAGIVVTALLFGAMHGSLIRLLPLSLLGLIFGIAVERTGSIFSSMIMHFVNNATALVLTYYGGAIPSLSSLRWPILLAAALVLGALVWLLLRSLGPGDASAAAVTTPMRMVVPAMVGVLVPAMLIYAYSVSSELVAVFAGP